ncbi:MAG: hypothetical protein M4579_000541 [Chaenotheca gracillima]|nr:MAG: hypothetical protein M4579_000541 [Chaenotheca gracillima]
MEYNKKSPDPAPTQANLLSWAPDLAVYRARRAQRLRAGGLQTCLPEAMPKIAKTDMTWTGIQFPNAKQYICSLGGFEVREIEAALAHFKGLGLDGDKVNVDNFPLPNLQDRLRQMSHDVHFGKGFCVIRGLDATSYSAEDNALLFLGISSYIGEKRGRQDNHGNMLVHIVEDKPKLPVDRSVPRFPRDSAEHLSYHTDQFCDVLAMQTRNCAAQGGSTVIASVEKVYNELAVTRPDLIHTLMRPDWPCDTEDIDDLRFCSNPRVVARPLLFHHDGRLMLNFSRGLFTNPEAIRPSLSEAQLEALDAVHYSAKKHHLEILTQPGDIQFLNNLGVLHGRKAFVDDSRNSRHMVRLWLHNASLAWRLPSALESARDRVYADNEEVKEVWELMPLPVPRPSYHYDKYAGSH